MKATLKGKGFVDNNEIDGGGFMNAGLVTYMWVQMGFPTGVAGVRSRITA